ncbi:histone H2A, sperm-like [Wyeomyia smithii]|uniref:histone H2A, sperm-like n=1 Tax=Wyeomyia smithii TaxID=174621 RepID=UPI002467F8AE|nr:histone H2A, sperm-like [Wyeomyia smithii]
MNILENQNTNLSPSPVTPQFTRCACSFSLDTKTKRTACYATSRVFKFNREACACLHSKISTQQYRMETRATAKERHSRSQRAGLRFPVARIHRQLRSGNYADRIDAGASVYLTAVIEYVATEILELAGKNALDSSKKRIIPRHVLCAIRLDTELNQMLGNVTIPQSGIIPQLIVLPPGMSFFTARCKKKAK